MEYLVDHFLICGLDIESGLALDILAGTYLVSMVMYKVLYIFIRYYFTTPAFQVEISVFLRNRGR